jgi:hypothetical protein
MDVTEKHIMIALIIAVILLILNIIIITTGGCSNGYLDNVEQFFSGEP